MFPFCASIKIIKLNMILDLARQYKSMRFSISRILKDEEFSLPLQPSIDAHSCAESFMEWIIKHDNANK